MLYFIVHMSMHNVPDSTRFAKSHLSSDFLTFPPTISSSKTFVTSPPEEKYQYKPNRPQQDEGIDESALANCTADPMMNCDKWRAWREEQ